MFPLTPQLLWGSSYANLPKPPEVKELLLQREKLTSSVGRSHELHRLPWPGEISREQWGGVFVGGLAVRKGWHKMGSLVESVGLRWERKETINAWRFGTPRIEFDPELRKQNLEELKIALHRPLADVFAAFCHICSSQGRAFGEKVRIFADQRVCFAHKNTSYVAMGPEEQLEKPEVILPHGPFRAFPK